MEDTLTVAFTYLVQFTVGIVGVTEYDSVGRTSLLTSCFHIAVGDHSVLFLRFQFTFLQTLDTERTFFDHTTATYSNIRVQYHAGEIVVHHEYSIIQGTYTFLQLVNWEADGSGIISPVKATYFIRTVVRAITGTDTTVIGHLVQTFAAVVGSGYRTNVLTWSVVAMLTKHWLENRLNAIGIVHITAEITVDTHPVHFVETQHLVLTYYENVVLCCTSYATSTATHAGVQVDAHGPTDTGACMQRIKCTFFFEFLQSTVILQFRITLFTDHFRILHQFSQGHFFDHFMTTFVTAMCLCSGDLVFGCRFSNSHFSGSPLNS